jgi:peptide/nickel transport system substrate-binding protein
LPGHHWWQLFNDKRAFDAWKQANIDIPSVGPWVTKDILPEGVVYERNPYYFKIDNAGNQLPYIDTVKAIPFVNAETVVLKMIAGEYDYMDFATTKSADYPGCWTWDSVTMLIQLLR